MWQCYSNKVWLICLLAHCSHLLQPLDLAVFASLKGHYRQEMEVHTAMSGSKTVGKVAFLQYYHTARQKALGQVHIEKGFKAAGIWPRDRTIPLNSSQVVVGRPVTPPGIIQPNSTYENPFIGFSTPKMPKDLLELQSSIQKWNFSTSNSTTRALFRKLARALEHKEVELATISQELAGIRGQLQAVRPTKRRKVRPEPNNRFVNIQAIQRTRERVERDQALLQLIEEDCIMVRVLKKDENKRSSYA